MTVVELQRIPDIVVELGSKRSQGVIGAAKSCHSLGDSGDSSLHIEGKALTSRTARIMVRIDVPVDSGDREEQALCESNGINASMSPCDSRFVDVFPFRLRRYK